MLSACQRVSPRSAQMRGVPYPHRPDAGLPRQFHANLDGLVSRVMAQPVIAIHHGAASAALVYAKLRILAEPPTAQHPAIMLGQPHTMAVDSHQRGMQHGLRCRRSRRNTRARLGQPRLDALDQQGFGKTGRFTFHDVSSFFIPQHIEGRGHSR